MSTTSIANNGSLKQDPQHTADLVELHFLKPIAVALYRYRRQNDTADFDRELTAPEKLALLRQAAASVRRNDPKYARPALFFSADSVTPKGIGSLPRNRRNEVVVCLEVALRAYDQALQAPPASIDAMRKLAEADSVEVH